MNILMQTTATIPTILARFRLLVPVCRRSSDVELEEITIGCTLVMLIGVY